MQARIHRGGHEIGGSCVEVQADDATILLDLGRPLWAERDEEIPLPDAVGLGEPGPLPLAVILTHGHQDHWGLVPQLPDSVPVWIGQGAADVLRAAAFWGTGIDLHETGHLQHRVPVTMGPFTITPYLADHSAFDAYSVLIEAGGRRLFYSGDLRGHGRKHRAFTWLLDDPPRDVDVMLLEGTNMRPDATDPATSAGPLADADTKAAATEKVDGPAASALPSEGDVETDLAATMKATPGLVVVLASAQNVDRLVTVYRATIKSGRDLAIDLYTAEIAAATGRDTIPHLGPDWPRLHAYLPGSQSFRVKKAKAFDRVDAVKPYRVFEEHLAAEPGRWVLLGAYQSHLPRLLHKGLLNGGVVVWSLWDGYLTDAGGTRLTMQLAAAGVPLLHHHTSGHASLHDLQRLVAAVHPHAVVPIHTQAPDRYGDVLGVEVATHDDGAWWAV